MSATAATSAEASTLADDRVNKASDAQPLDATKLNALLDDVRARLTTDIYGNWLINGSKLSNDTRHGALGLVFQLVSELEAVKAALDKQKAPQSGMPVTEGRKAGKGGNNLLHTIRSEVEQQLSTPLNDLGLRCSRLEEQLQKIKTKETELEKKQFDDGQKLKDLSTKLNKTQQSLTERPAPRSATKSATEISLNVKSALLDKVNVLTKPQPSCDWTIHEVERTVVEIRVLVETFMPNVKLEPYLADVLKAAEVMQTRKAADTEKFNRAGARFREWQIWQDIGLDRTSSDIARRYECLSRKKLKSKLCQTMESNKGERAATMLACLDETLVLEDKTLAVSAKLFGGL